MKNLKMIGLVLSLSLTVFSAAHANCKNITSEAAIAKVQELVADTDRVDRFQARTVFLKKSRRAKPNTPTVEVFFTYDVRKDHKVGVAVLDEVCNVTEYYESKIKPYTRPVKETILDENGEEVLVFEVCDITSTLEAISAKLKLEKNTQLEKLKMDLQVNAFEGGWNLYFEGIGFAKRSKKSSEYLGYVHFDEKCDIETFRVGRF